MKTIFDLVNDVIRNSAAIADRMDEVHAINANTPKPSTWAQQKAAVYDHLVATVKLAQELEGAAREIKKRMAGEAESLPRLQTPRGPDAIITRFNTECRGPETGTGEGS